MKDGRIEPVHQNNALELRMARYCVSGRDYRAPFSQSERPRGLAANEEERGGGTALDFALIARMTHD